MDFLRKSETARELAKATKNLAMSLERHESIDPARIPTLLLTLENYFQSKPEAESALYSTLESAEIVLISEKNYPGRDAVAELVEGFRQSKIFKSVRLFDSDGSELHSEK